MARARFVAEMYRSCKASVSTLDHLPPCRAPAGSILLGNISRPIDYNSYLSY